ncbi:hypothetical protein B14911_12977 [Bacillus sp. NRRL B-14911]|uniref:Uncharacterized protein n=1 Tax=Bacillus infantis NRRL B-14911 TaxID=1367477 RepID=U5LH58_9BACI|nr:hypothetical protein N288_24655 [Bacillus infantis NRRL B-14911]EAR67678.1 hypothetical protein B14911_12977 [Bacillus sp. NRRL B-14911]
MGADLKGSVPFLFLQSGLDKRRNGRKDNTIDTVKVEGYE